MCIFYIHFSKDKPIFGKMYVFMSDFSKDNPIIGRKNEIEVFERLKQSNQAEFVTIFGRRRVGKTFLVREYFKDLSVFEFTGAFEAENAIQVFNFFAQLKRQSNLFEDAKPPKNWAEAFNYLTDYLLQTSKNNSKMVVFIDELPWLDQPKSGFLSALEYFWNQHGSQIKNLILITCGSAASWIIKNLVNAKGGLYNRITQRIELKPFTLSETEEFLQSKYLKFTRFQITQLYMVMGGIPFYLNAIRQGLSVSQVIDELCFESGGLLSNEFKPLYHSLFKNAQNHIAIIEALASHPYGLTRKKLLSQTKIPNGGAFTRVIENLEDSGFIKALAPFGKRNKDTIFRVIDFFSIFYLKFIKNNVSERKNVWESLASEANFSSWTGYAFENICLAHLNAIHQKLSIAGVYTQVSSWRFEGNDEIGGAQIDLIIDRKDGIIHLCEAKFSSNNFIISKDYTAKLRQKRTVFQYINQSKKSIVTTLLTSFPAVQNQYYSEEVHSEICIDDLF
jgi:uncharacterized protein